MPFAPHASDRPLLVGVVHLLPLPGAPRPSPGLEAVEARALHDARALYEGGADGVIVENYGDAPFTGGPVGPWTTAAMTRIAVRIRALAPERMLGINVLRNDARAALAVAEAAGADFIRVNVHIGAMLTDQGVITGAARETLLERNRIGSRVAVVADVHVKHAVPLGPIPLEQAARDAWSRGHADVLVVTGPATGALFDPDHVRRVRAAVPDAPLWVGSGLDPTSARAHGSSFDGAIVGTWLHERGEIAAPIDPDRVRAVRDALTRGTTAQAARAADSANKES